jgi:DNA-binding transcriptional ArsR family regulator
VRDTRQSAASASQADRNLTSVIDDPVRSAMLAALAGGRALPAGELARRAGLQPRAASVHLRQLTDAGLVRVRVQGRHRHREIANPEVRSPACSSTAAG